jgi:hypothetical protein
MQELVSREVIELSEAELLLVAGGTGGGGDCGCRSGDDHSVRQNGLINVNDTNVGIQVGLINGLLQV